MKPRARLAVLMTAVLAPTVLGACQASAPGPPTIVFEEMRFVPNVIDARAGVPLSVRLTNNGRERHDLNFPSLHMPGLEGVDAILEPGETRTTMIAAERPLADLAQQVVAARGSLDALLLRLIDLEVDRSSETRLARGEIDRLLRLALGQARHRPVAKLASPGRDR